MSGIASAAFVVSLIGTGYAAYSSYQAGQQQAAINAHNAQLQAAQNQYQLQASAAKSLAQREENQRILAQQEAAYAAAGVVTNSGSPLVVETKQAALLERRALDTDYEGAIAYRTGTGAVWNDEAAGTAAKSAGNMNATATLLQGTGSAVSSYGNAKGYSKSKGTG